MSTETKDGSTLFQFTPANARRMNAACQEIIDILQELPSPQEAAIVLTTVHVNLCLILELPEADIERMLAAYPHDFKTVRAALISDRERTQ